MHCLIFLTFLIIIGRLIKLNLMGNFIARLSQFICRWIFQPINRFLFRPIYRLVCFIRQLFHPRKPDSQYRNPNADFNP
jgi:hypothetical protein